jgi:hypothetical protein
VGRRILKPIGLLASPLTVGDFPSKNKMPIINLPSSFVGSTTQVMSQTITDLNPYTQLVLGIILAVVVVEILIHAIRPK